MPANMFDRPEVEYVPLNGGYRNFNHAILHGTGLTHVFDFMRYERAFMVRDTDLAFLLEAAREYADWATRRYAFLMCKYDFTGKTKPGWNMNRLLSSQELELITDPAQIIQLGAEHVLLRPAHPLKLQHIVTVKDKPVGWVLGYMFLNHAVPCDEGDSNVLERQFFDAERTPPNVRLTNFCASKTLWREPQ